MKRYGKQYKILFLLLLYMPFHYYICELLLKNWSFDNVLRDIVIISLLILCIKNNDGKIYLDNISKIIFANIFILLIFAIFSYAINDYSGIFNIFRTYVIPMLIFFPCSMIKFNAESYKNMNKALIIEMIIIGIYGVFQAFALGDSFLVKLGYDSINGHLSSSAFYLYAFGWFQRSVGTFVSPNQFGLVLSIMFCLLLYSNIDYKFKHKKILIILYIVSIIATFSRSSILGLLIVIICGYFKNYKKIKITKKVLLSSLIVFLIAIVIYIYIDSKYLNGLFTKMFSTAFGSVVNKTDASSAAHLKDLYKPLSVVFNSPFWGLGFGNNGPLALGYSEDALAVESSFYLMMYEEGIFFGMLFFMPYILVVINTFKNKQNNYVVPCMVCILILFTYIFLPNCQSFETLFYSYVFIGFSCNESLKEISKKYIDGRNNNEKNNLCNEC